MPPRTQVAAASGKRDGITAKKGLSNETGFRLRASGFSWSISALEHKFADVQNSRQDKVVANTRMVLAEARSLQPEARTPLLRRFLRPLRERTQKRIRRRRRINLSRERRPERHHAPVELARAVLVLLDLRAIQRESGKHTAGPRVRQHLRSHLPIRIAFRMTPDGPRRHRCIASQFKLARYEMLP